MINLPWPMAIGLFFGLISYKDFLCAAIRAMTTANVVFLFLFTFRYLRYIVHNITGIFLYRPALPRDHPAFINRSVAVIIPTVAPNTVAFLKCCESILSNQPRVLIISTVGIKLARDTRNIFCKHNFDTRFPHTKLAVVRIDEANKRKQIVEASWLIDSTDTPITICADDHVYWPPTFLASLLPAFDDPRVGLVGTSKKVIRDPADSLYKSFTNFIACLYLERDNFRIRSEPYMDYGVFCVSGRTSAILTDILKNEHFRQGYVNEMFFFGWLGPLNPDDDNYIVRYVLRNGWKIAFQCMPECTIRTPLGNPQKFWNQVLRVLTQTTWYTASSHRGTFITPLLVWIFVSKMIKIAPHFYDHPSDLLWLPAYLAYAYWHSFVKLYCALTFWNHSWGGRDLNTLTKVSINNIDKEVFMQVAPARPEMLRGITGLYSNDLNLLPDKHNTDNSTSMGSKN
ncbi:hypothetical protein N0V93_009022 [Gnomoniopsis smithogilvyi]|uniref:Glycosyltransferase family 2 protein n=1 Tax=Gnomoniopsis smithogilvyi TaxID=1191159 RepID=A0A9W8YIW3_9PEZI|nr:hypothetical protein N0V93_009022 [Gnomoniopsis smithogilvyi]